MPPKNQPGKDIRSFFTSITSKTSPSSSSKGSIKEEDGKRKKKPTVIESDSDSDGPFIGVKKTKKEEEQASTKNNNGSASKTSKLSLKKKEPEAPLKPVDIKDVFGSSPIRRSKDVPEKRKRTAEEHDDEDFNATLKQLDEAPKKKSKTIETDKEKASLEEKVKIVSPEKSPVRGKPPPAEVRVKQDKAADTSRKSPIKNAKSTAQEEKPVERRTSPRKNGQQSEATKRVVKQEMSPEDKPVKVKKEPAESKATTPSKGKASKKEVTKVIFESPVKKETHGDSAPSSPAFDPLEKRRQQAENYRKFLSSHNTGAKNPGSKPIPEGAAGCLSGLTIVVTGVLDSLQREEAEELIKRYGGKATKSVSRNTSYILAGDDAGPSKLSKAKELNVPLISEDDFLHMIATRPAHSASSPAGKTGGKHASSTTPKSSQKSSSARKAVKTEPDEEESKSQKTAVAKKIIKSEPAEEEKAGPSSSSQKTKPAEKVAMPVSQDQAEVTLPWVDKYKPTNLKQIIGLQGDRSNAKKLLHWLQHWYENHTGNKKLTRPSPWSTTDDGAYFKAALLSGPPGIGKTTTAHLVAKELGYDLVEMNASDTRSKRLLHEHVKELLSCQSLASFAHGARTVDAGRKRVLVMDEVDGMAGNEDRGGMQELIGLIKTSKVPIICICNDRQHPKVRSLSNYCYDLKFSKPRVEQIRGAMMSICFKEGLKIKPEALDEIIMGANCDVRQVLHHLSMLAANAGKGISTEEAKVEASKSKKDLKLGPWEVVRRVFSAEEHKGMSIHDKSNLFFQDYSFGPLFVQENYPLVAPAASRGKPIQTLDLLARTAHCLSETDLIEKVIRSQNAWSLLPVEAVFASVVPGQLMEGTICGQIAFPSWLGKNSRQNKMDRLLQELQMHMRLRISASKRAVNLDYLPHLVRGIVGPLRRDGIQGVDQAVRAMENYDLIREDLDSLLELSQWPNKPDIMAGIDGKVKAAFTRAYNKEAHLTPYAAARVKKTGRGGAKGTEEELELEEGEEGLEGEGDDEEESDDIALDAMIKVKKPTGKSAAAAAEKKTKAASSGATTSSRGGRGRGRASKK